MTTDSSEGEIIEKTQATVSAWARYWEKIDWDALLAAAISKGISILFTTLIFIFVLKIGKRVMNHIYEGYMKKTDSPQGRVKTVRILLDNIYSYTLYFFYIYAILSIFGVPVGSLIAGAGIFGIAIGLGAQGFMNDIITGFFILLERQLDVGDYVKLLNISIEGTVTAVGIRTTQLRGLDGTVHFIPNRNITTISNLSRSNMQAIVDIRIDPAEGLEQLEQLIADVNARLKEEHPEITDGPTIFGLVDLGNGNFAYRTILYTVNGQQASIKETFLKNYVDALTSAGFTIPSTLPLVGK